MEAVADVYWLNSAIAASLAHGFATRGYRVRGLRLGDLPCSDVGAAVESESVPGERAGPALERHADIFARVVVVAPLLPASRNWVDASTVEGDVERAIEQPCVVLQALGKRLMRQRCGSVFVLSPQVFGAGAFDADARSEFEARKRILSEGLYAMTKVFALELASRNIRAHFVDLAAVEETSDAVELMHWLSSEDLRYTTGRRWSIGG